MSTEPVPGDARTAAAAGVARSGPGVDADAPLMTLSAWQKRKLLTSMLVTFLCLFATYAGVIVILLPEQVANLDPANKVANLAIVTATSSAFTLIVQPIVGALSDRTRSRLGRRSPWILLGGVGGGICAIALQFAPSVFWITLIWVIAQVVLNALQGPMSAVISDRIEQDGRATASAFTGVGMSIGGTVGIIVAGQLLAHLGVAYTIFGVAMILVTIAFVLFNRDAPTQSLPRERFNWIEFAKGFWVSPRKHPDYTWAFSGRFVMILGYQAIQAYQLYILIDYIHLSPVQAGATAGLLSTVSMVTLVISTLVFGKLSDKLNRRKLFVFFASVVMAIAILIPVTAPTVGSMIVYSAIVSIGYGAYAAVDLALMIDVLPSRGSAGKDLGILNVATNIPQALTPAIAAVLLTVFANNYAAIFVYAAVMVLASSFLVFPIKSVR